MNEPSKIDMNEVTRLTREGRLREAMALLQGAGGSTDRGTRPGQLGPASDGNAAQPQKLTRTLHGLIDRLGLGKQTPPPPPERLSESARPAAGAGSHLQGVHLEAADSESGRFEARSFSSAAGSRAYRVYVPASYRGQPAPLVVMLHGCTQSAEDFATGTRMNDIAETHGVLVAYPEQPRSANPNLCWNWFSRGDQQRDQGEPSLIAGITREVMRDFAIQPGRIYIAGLSAGGATAALMGSLYPELFAAVGVHSGLASGAAGDAGSAFRAMRHGAPEAALSSRRGNKVMPTIVFHGDRDRTVNPVNGAQVISQAGAAAPMDVATRRDKAKGGVEYTRTVRSDPAGRPVLEHWVIHGAGHAWSGGNPNGSHTDANGPDASAEMMRFFLQHGAATQS